MGNTLTLDALKQQIEDNYGPLVLQGFPGAGGDIKLLPLMRLTRDRRDEVSAAMRDMGSKAPAADGSETEPESADLNDTIDKVTKLIGLECEKPDDIKRITKGLDDDGQAILALWDHYQQETKLGEAPPSAA